MFLEQKVRGLGINYLIQTPV